MRRIPVAEEIVVEAHASVGVGGWVGSLEVAMGIEGG
jgi:hypothetical protein